MKELDQELRMTAKALGEKTLKNKALSETVLAGLLDQYSERLVSIFDEKLRLTLHPGKEDIPDLQSPLKESLQPVSEGEGTVHGVRGLSSGRRASAKD